jgi:release factor glutamine methyltransferase
LSILDIGTGSGCIAIALKHNLHSSNVWAIDISEEALSLARQNSIINKLDINFVKADILQTNSISFDNRLLDIIVSNPPYVLPSQKAQMFPNVLQYEPHIALFAPENDPFIYYKCISDFANRYLKKGGKLFFEINELYPQEIAEILLQAGLGNVSTQADINGKWRIVHGTKK